MIFASAGRNLWWYILFKVFGPLYERMVQPSSKPSVTVSAIISTPPETATPYCPQGWKQSASFVPYRWQKTAPITLRKTSPHATGLAFCPNAESVAGALLSLGAAGGEIRALAALVMPPLSCASLLARIRRASGVSSRAFCRLLPANTTSQSTSPVSSPLAYSL
ncbi:unnamed protein product [Ascophyllum nodosum]